MGATARTAATTTRNSTSSTCFLWKAACSSSPRERRELRWQFSRRAELCPFPCPTGIFATASDRQRKSRPCLVSRCRPSRSCRPPCERLCRGCLASIRTKPCTRTRCPWRAEWLAFCTSAVPYKYPTHTHKPLAPSTPIPSTRAQQGSRVLMLPRRPRLVRIAGRPAGACVLSPVPRVAALQQFCRPRGPCCGGRGLQPDATMKRPCAQTFLGSWVQRCRG